MLRPLLSDSLWVGLWGALLVVGASGLVHLSRELVRHQALSRAVASLAGVWGVALLLEPLAARRMSCGRSVYSRAALRHSGC